MKWPFQRRPQKQTTRNETAAREEALATGSQTSNTGQSEPPELLLLLLRPSLVEIFDSPSVDNPPVDAHSITTTLGMYTTVGLHKHELERLSVLAVSENGTVCYTIPMILDLRLWLSRLAANRTPPIDYPLGLFTNRDVIVVSKGLYTVRLSYRTPQDALEHLGTSEFLASNIIYASTTTDEGVMKNLRRLEAMAKYLLTPTTPERTTLPKLPSELIDEWQHDFLEPIFRRAKQNRQ